MDKVLELSEELKAELDKLPLFQEYKALKKEISSSEEIKELKKYYGKKCVIYDGKMTAKQKDKAEYEFMNNPKVKVFIGQIIACSVGLTLTAAHTLVFNSYSWVAADNKQAEDRIYRINQTEDVTCIYQLFNDSISQNMFDKVIRKQVIMDTIINSENEKKKQS